VTPGSPLGLTDLHSHLVPAVDDGAPSLEHAMEGIGRMVEAGVTRIVTTPHLDASLTMDPARLTEHLDAVAAAFAPVAAASATAWPELDLGQAYEVRLDVPDAVFSDPRLCLPGTQVALVEWAALRAPPESTRALEALMAQGVRPLLAHPERYRGQGDRIELAGAWREAGAWFLVNHGSLAGRYGPEAQTLAERLLARGWVDALTTDFHGRPRLSLYIDESRSWFEARDALDSWRLLTADNPARIARGEAPIEVVAIRRPEGFADRVRRVLGGRRD
jgi:protein-tyrosine phosphatase